MGLSGSGKSYLSKKLIKKFPDFLYYNADIIREKYNDWDFSEEGRTRQAIRMSNLIGEKDGIADFICPTPETRKLFNPDFIIYMNTIEKCKYEDTNSIFIPPKKCDIVINNFNYDIEEIYSRIKR